MFSLNVVVVLTFCVVLWGGEFFPNLAEVPTFSCMSLLIVSFRVFLIFVFFEPLFYILFLDPD